MSKFYITTAIDYPNALPHVGTAFEKIGADIQARFRRYMGDDVYFLMGNDENTVKVLKAAQEIHPSQYPTKTVEEFRKAQRLDYVVDPKVYVDDMADKFKLIWNLLDISNNDFIQTTEERHRIGVQKFIQTVYDAGYIYKKAYKSSYCEGCEEFKTAKSLINGKCPQHLNVPVVQAEEENYFFKLSHFKPQLLALLNEQAIKIEPESRHNEIKGLLDTDLEDISISRVGKNWGIPCPFDESQTVYVWFDALLSYITGVGFGTDEDKFDKYWPANIHVVGKDITRFHCAIWPAMIMAYNEKAEKKIAFPEGVFAHGFIYRRDRNELVKESKSSADAVDLVSLQHKFGSDGLRYYFMSKCSFAGDGEYSLEHIKEVYNSELANNLGNLVSRTFNMVYQYFGGNLGKQDAVKTWLIQDDVNKWKKSIETFNYREGLSQIWKLLHDANEYIDQTKPWALAKTDLPSCRQTLHDLVACIGIAATMLYPYLPKTAVKIFGSFGSIEGRFDSSADRFHEGIFVGDVVLKPIEGGKYPPLFPRIA